MFLSFGNLFAKESRVETHISGPKLISLHKISVDSIFFSFECNEKADSVECSYEITYYIYSDSLKDIEGQLKFISVDGANLLGPGDDDYHNDTVSIAYTPGQRFIIKELGTIGSPYRATRFRQRYSKFLSRRISDIMSYSDEASFAFNPYALNDWSSIGPLRGKLKYKSELVLESKNFFNSSSKADTLENGIVIIERYKANNGKSSPRFSLGEKSGALFAGVGLGYLAINKLTVYDIFWEYIYLYNNDWALFFRLGAESDFKKRSGVTPQVKLSPPFLDNFFAIETSFPYNVRTDSFYSRIALSADIAFFSFSIGAEYDFYKEMLNGFAGIHIVF